MAHNATRICKSISISSGKGGVGKTVTTVQLALAMQKMGKQVLLLDGDFGLANADIVLGMSPQFSIFDVIDGNAQMDEVVLVGPEGLRLIPSGSGILKLSKLPSYMCADVIEEVEKIVTDVDYLIIDTGAGINDTVLSLNAASDINIIVTTPEPHALADAYALIKVMSEVNRRKIFHLIVNMVRTPSEAFKVHTRLAEVSKKFLGIDIKLLGSIPYDIGMQNLIMKRQLGSSHVWKTIAGQNINNLAREVLTINPGYQRIQNNLWQVLANHQEENQQNPGRVFNHI